MGSNNEGDKTIKQYVATKKGGPFAVVEGPYPTPGPDEICIRNVAVGLNPLDWKNLYHGEMVKAWPEIFGIDTAGFVEAVGENVTGLKAGDAVMSLAGHGGRAGAFQEVTTVPAHFASKKPTCWTFEEASSVP
jgi:NADPH:quinone reductase-like Zn-dependent oxidoreductase